MLLQKSRKPLN